MTLQNHKLIILYLQLYLGLLLLYMHIFEASSQFKYIKTFWRDL